MFRWNVPCALLCLTLTLVGCQAAGAAGEDRTIPNLNLFSAAEDPAATAGVPTAMPPVAQSSGTQGNEDVWRFTFPTPGPEPVTLWRPPLYPAPWALAPFDHFYFSRPIAVDEVNWPLANYRYGGIFFGADIVHTGVDITAPRGTPVLAAGPGKVVWAGYGLYLGNNNPGDPYGLAVTIRHDFGYQGRAIYTVYAHMDRIDAVVGQRAETGTILGVVGSTGNTTGPHLHFEVRIKNNSFFATRNPELWLAPPQGWGVLAGRLMNTNGSLLSRQDVTVRSLDSGRKWIITSYGEQIVISDDYYHENLVLSDLPAGKYEVTVDYLEERYTTEMEIHPGAVTYFTFRGENGFNFSLPPLSGNTPGLPDFTQP